MVDATRLPGKEQFAERLAGSLQQWRAEGCRGVWLEVPRTRTELIPAAIAEGFQIHHAQLEYIMLTIWLPPSQDSLPPYANHYLGVGGVVLNGQDELLVVTERHQPVGFDAPKLRYQLKQTCGPSGDNPPFSGTNCQAGMSRAVKASRQLWSARSKRRPA